MKSDPYSLVVRLALVAGALAWGLPALAQEAAAPGASSQVVTEEVTRPPEGFGIVTGTLFDGSNGQPVRGAAIEASGPQSKKTISDLNGRYKMILPPGTYELKITANGYLDASLDSIEVTAKLETEASSVLTSSSKVTTVDVVEKVSALTATAEAMIAERKLAPTVSDGISSEEIRNSTASDAAAALEKVTGVSVVDGGYVYVRGLGERYSATMLNSAMLPTTEPERRVVPLDLFPAALIDNIKVLKTYTPDLPGEFSGGLVQMQTIDFPTQKTMRVGLSVDYNSRTSFGNWGSYPGGQLDFFGFDDGTRDLPPGITPGSRLFPGNFTEAEFEKLGESFPTNWEPNFSKIMRPGLTYQVAAGNTFGKLGIVGAVTFTNSPQRFSELQRYLVNQGGGVPLILTEYPDFKSYSESMRLGAVFNASYKITDLNRISFRNTLTRDSEKEARRFEGFNGGIDGPIRAERLRWLERGLIATGVEGEHSMPNLGNTLLTWQFTYSTSKRDEPDLREVIRADEGNGRYPFISLPSSGLRFTNYLRDKIYEPQAALSKPFYAKGIGGVLKVGFRGTIRDREFAARRFRFVPVRTQTLNLYLPSNQLFAPQSIRPDGFVVRENTRGTDAYSAEMDVYGGFAQVDLTLGPRWRVIAGARIEDAAIDVTTIDPLVPGAVPVSATLINRDWLPSGNLIYALTPRQNLRFAYGRTLSRPDFRELSPFDFTNVLGGFNVVGNPKLLRAKIDNVDARWEWFLGGNQILAASAFFKWFDDPIEVTLQPTTSDFRQSFLNADTARNFGLEVEFRKNLGFVKPSLRQFSVQTNFTLVDSNVVIPESQRFFLTSLSRPLMGQSRYIFNAIAEWTKPQWRSNARFYANTVSRRISEVGAVGLPDIYQERNVFLDFVYQFDVLESGKLSLKFSAQNLGDNQYRWTQAGILQRSFYTGRTFSIGTSFSIF